MVIVGIISPLWLFFVTRRKIRDRSDMERWYKNYSAYSFILGGYKEEYYYWEFLIILRKFLLIIVVVWFKDASLLGQCILL